MSNQERLSREFRSFDPERINDFDVRCWMLDSLNVVSQLETDIKLLKQKLAKFEAMEAATA